MTCTAVGHKITYPKLTKIKYYIWYNFICTLFYPALLGISFPLSWRFIFPGTFLLETKNFISAGNLSCYDVIKFQPVLIISNNITIYLKNFDNYSWKYSRSNIQILAFSSTWISLLQLLLNISAHIFTNVSCPCISPAKTLSIFIELSSIHVPCYDYSFKQIFLGFYSAWHDWYNWWLYTKNFTSIYFRTYIK